MSDRGKQRAREGMTCSDKKPTPQAAATEPSPPRQDIPARSLLMSHGLRRIAFAAAALFSASLHAAAFVACLTWSEPTDYGAAQVPIEVVSIELSPSRVLEARPQTQQQEPAPSMEEVAPTEGNHDEDVVPKQAREEQQPEEPTPEQPIDPPKVEPEPAAVVPPDLPQTVADAEALPAGLVAEKQEPQAEQPPKPEPKEEARREPEKEKKKEEKEEKENHQARQKGGATSHARSGKGRGRARASASSGSILRYASYVRARVAGNKPAGNGHRGTASIAFGVTRSGGLAYARIRRSSGSAALDRLALGAVRGAAPFPRPPTGARPRQLRFSITIHFR